MHGIKEIIQEAKSLPVEERGVKIDREWVKVAKHRLSELQLGAVKSIPGNEVFAKVRERFEK
jgi:hypothetical protein